MVGYVLRRMLFGAMVVVLTGVIAVVGWRALRPDQFPGESLIGGSWHQLTRAFFHLDFGRACMYQGCPAVHDLWTRGIQADLWLLVGGTLVGVLGGVAAGAWCAAHRGSFRARVVEMVGMFFLSLPPFFLGYGLLLLFAPDFGLLSFPFLFRVHIYAHPFVQPGEFARAMVIPCLLVGLPLAAGCQRLTLAVTSDARDEDWVRTALAKGVSRSDAIRKHARPVAYGAVSSYVGSIVPLMVTNMILAEAVFSVPGFFVHTRRALGQAPGYSTLPDPVVLQALALWAAVLIVAIGIIADLVLVAVDPRIRAAGRV